MRDAAAHVRFALGSRADATTATLGGYVCDEEPMYRDGTHIKSLVAYEYPARPVIARLELLLTPDTPTAD